MGQIDVMSVGDIVTDAFIKLEEEHAFTYKDENGMNVLAMELGSKLPFNHAEIKEAVGNAPNAAVSFARLGLNSGLVSNVGGDPAGRDMINHLHKEKVDSRFVRVNPDNVSNYHYVLWYKEERTILIKHEEYDYHWPHFRDKEIPKWVYFSSISENAMDMHDDMAEWFENHPDTHLAFQPGTFQIAAGTERLARLYRETDIVLMNREEAVQVTGGNYDDLHDLINKLHELGPQVVVVTDGPAAAYASDGENRFKMPPYPDPAPPLERTGAGDAFSSAFVAAIIKGASVEGALQWAPINSMNVVQHVGAQEGLLTEAQMNEYLHKAPGWYKPERF